MRQARPCRVARRERVSDMALTSPTLTELQACRESLAILYVNGIMGRTAYTRAMNALNAAIDAKIGA